MRTLLNLATRPARNERLPTLLFALAASALVLVTVRHAFVAASLASAAATRLDQEVDQLQAELQRLREREQTLGRVKPPAPAVERWALLKGLVDRRTFSWTGLLGRLEAALPPDVRLTGIRPEARRDRLRLRLEAVARNADDALAVVKILEDRPEFAGVLVLSIGEGREGTKAEYEMYYRPEGGGDEKAGGERGAAVAEAGGRGETGP